MLPWHTRLQRSDLLSRTHSSFLRNLSCFQIFQWAKLASTSGFQRFLLSPPRILFSYISVDWMSQLKTHLLVEAFPNYPKSSSMNSFYFIFLIYYIKLKKYLTCFLVACLLSVSPILSYINSWHKARCLFCSPLFLEPETGSRRLQTLNKYLWNEWFQASNRYQNALLTVAFRKEALKWFYFRNRIQ